MMTDPVTMTAHSAPAAPPGRPSLFGAKLFVTIVFCILAAGFIGSTWLLIAEFRNHDPLTLILAHSHLFLFFPTFGILALCAFFLPSVVFTHLYWYKLPWGKARFLFGFVVAIGMTVWVTSSMLGPDASPRAIWEVAPSALDTDRGEPANCVANRAQSCSRGAILPVLQTLRSNAQRTPSLSKFGRPCAYDRLLEVPEEHGKQRWCFPAHRMADTQTCCKAQEAFSQAVAERYAAPKTRSTLSQLDTVLQPLKIFFIVVLLVIGIMLVVWQQHVIHYYPDLTGRLERNIFIGGIALLLWPIMDYAYLDVSNALFGRATNDLQPRLSLVVAPWSMLLLFYYLKRFARRVEVIGQIVGVAGGLLAVIVRDDLKDWAVKFVGIGMPWWMLIVLGLAWIAGMVAVLAPQRWLPKPQEASAET